MGKISLYDSGERNAGGQLIDQREEAIVPAVVHLNSADGIYTRDSMKSRAEELLSLPELRNSAVSPGTDGV